MNFVKYLSSTNNRDNRLLALSRLIFQNEYSSVSNFELKCNANRTLLKGATEYILVNGYAPEKGCIDWTNLQQDMLKAIRGRDDADM